MAINTSADNLSASVANPLNRYVKEYLGAQGQIPEPTDPIDRVFYLRADTLSGAQALLSKQFELGQKLSVEDFPFALRGLTAAQMDGFLCIYGMRIKEFTTTDWIRIDRDWRGT